MLQAEQTSEKRTSSISQQFSKLRVHKAGSKTAASQGASGEEEQQSEVMERAAVVSPSTPAIPDEVKLPQSFLVKYLGKREARGLWGIKHTRKPVDDMVAAARTLKTGTTMPLPFLQLHVTEKGVKIEATKQNLNNNFESGPYAIDCISYGVQDLVYTRVFAMIVVKEGGATGEDQKKVSQAAVGFKSPFECFAFVCDSRQSARKLTFALAKAFQDFSKTVKGNPQLQKKKPRQFAIDIRTPEQIEEDLRNDADSEV